MIAGLDTIRNASSSPGHAIASGTRVPPSNCRPLPPRKGVVLVPVTVDEDELMLVALDAGADDIVADGEMWQVTSGPSELNAVRDALTEAGSAKQVLRLMELLDDLDDVQDVHANFDISDELMEAAAG